MLDFELWSRGFRIFIPLADRKAAASWMLIMEVRPRAGLSSHVKKPLYLFRKWVEEVLDLYLPRAGWATQYSRVTFSNMRYSEVNSRAQQQARIFNGALGLTMVAFVGSGFWFARLGGLQRVKMGFLRSICWVARRLAGE